MYKLTQPDFDGQVRCVQRLSDNAFIPMDPANTDYQEYLKWLDGYEIISGEWVKTSEGNEPLAAEEPNQ